MYCIRIQIQNWRNLRRLNFHFEKFSKINIVQLESRVDIGNVLKVLHY